MSSNLKAYGDTKPETIIISGTARLPKQGLGERCTGILRIELELTTADSQIIDCSCTELSPLAERLLRNALLAHQVEDGITNAMNQVRTRYFSPLNRAISSALEDTLHSYRRTQLN